MVTPAVQPDVATVARQNRYGVVIQRIAAMGTGNVVGRLGRMLSEPPVYAVSQGQPLGFGAGQPAVVFADGSAFVVQRAPVGGVPRGRRRLFGMLPMGNTYPLRFRLAPC